MPLPKCIECKHYKLERIVNHQAKQYIHVHTCQNPEYGNVIDGSPIQAEQCRAIDALCGWQARGFEQKPAEPEPEKKSNVIQLEAA